MITIGMVHDAMCVFSENFEISRQSSLESLICLLCACVKETLKLILVEFQ